MSAFVIGDTHWGHAKSLSFDQPDGSPLRPFSSCEEMDETMVERWNSVVKEKDTVYHLGDVAIPRSGLKNLAKCNGRKILIRGNHDTFKLKDYAEYFEDIRGAMFHHAGKALRGGLIFTHIPVHPDNLRGHYLGCVHGHLHCHLVFKDGQIDQRFFNACVERNDFTPVALELIVDHFRTNVRGAANF